MRIRNQTKKKINAKTKKAALDAAKRQSRRKCDKKVTVAFAPQCS